MKVYRISKCEYIKDLRGTGAAAYGGRWHNKGTYILYTASSPSLALLESVVHISNIACEGFCMTTLEIPENNIQTLSIVNLPKDWQQNPPPDILKNIGDNFIKKNRYLALQLPSVIMPEENNVLINPNHRGFDKIKVLSTRNIDIDGRLMKR